MIERVDIAIVGGGPVGLSLALALRDAGLAVTVLEARPDVPVTDARAIVLSYGSRLILERLGVWAHLATTTAPTPITQIHVSQRGRFGRSLLTATSASVPALGYTVEYTALHAALTTAAKAAGVSVRYDAPVTLAEPGRVVYRGDPIPLLTPPLKGEELGVMGADLASLPFKGRAGMGEVLTTELVVLAEGGRGLPQNDASLKDYAQSAIVCEVESEQPHLGLAYERFTPEGPIALLPLGNRYALVWTTPAAQVAERLAWSDADFLAGLYAAFGERQGRFVAASARAAFPLRMALRGAGETAGVVRIGNAAQLLHPVAGQGFNLGLRDAWQLAETILDTPTGGLDKADLLQRYVRARGADVSAGARVTDLLVEVFSNDLPLIAQARGLALTALDLFQPLKNGFARKMMHGARTW